MTGANQVSVLVIEERRSPVVTEALVRMPISITSVRPNADVAVLARKNEFALLLIDAGIEQHVALGIASAVRSVKGSEHTPVVVLVGKDTEARDLDSEVFDAADFILTPVRPEALRARVGVFVELARKRQEVLTQADVLKRRARQMQGLAAASIAIHAPRLTLNERLRSVVQTARDVLDAHQAVIAVSFNLPQRRSSREAVAWSLSEKYEGHRERLRDDEAWRSRALLDVGDSAIRLTRGELLRVTGPREENALPWWGVVAAPLVDSTGAHIGVLEVSDKRVDEFNPDDEAILIQLAQLGSVALQNCINDGVREANRIKDEFLGVLSHELRIPLHAILGWTQHLKGMLDPGDAMAHGLDVIARNARAQAELVEDLLDVSRITSGKLQLQKRRLAIGKLVREVIESCKPLAADKGVGLTLRLAEPIGPVMGDRGRLRQVLNNLLSNAIKFTPKGRGVEVGVDDDEREVIIRVSDRGEGITPEFLPFVFERFRQDPSIHKGQRGLGLGLAIVRHIVELHDGRVDAFSDGAGRGATFTVRIPHQLTGDRRIRDEVPTPVPSSPSAA